MQLFLPLEQLRQSFMLFHSSEYNFSQDLYSGFFFAVVSVFSCPILSRVINTQDARHRLLKTEQDKYKQGDKNMLSGVCFWGAVLQLEEWTLVDFVLKTAKQETRCCFFMKPANHIIWNRVLLETKWGFFGNACWKLNTKKMSLDVLGKAFS